MTIQSEFAIDPIWSKKFNPVWIREKNIRLRIRYIVQVWFRDGSELDLIKNMLLWPDSDFDSWSTSLNVHQNYSIHLIKHVIWSVCCWNKLTSSFSGEHMCATFYRHSRLFTVMASLLKQQIISRPFLAASSLSEFSYGISWLLFVL